MKRNQQELMDVMYHHRLSATQVADLLYCKPNTVRVWRCETGMSMPDAKLELLKLKLKANQNG
jgi:uncharacterized protein YjcR